MVGRNSLKGMFYWISGSVIFLSLGSPATAEPVRLSNGPAAKWTLVEKDGERHCQLRTQINGSTPLNVLDVDRSLGAGKYEWRFVGSLTGKPLSECKAGYVIGMGSPRYQSVVEADGENERRAVELEFEGDEAASISEGTPVSIVVSRGVVIAIDTSGMVGLLPALDACSRNRLIEVGADPQMVAQTAKEADLSDADFLRVLDFPTAALRRHEQGTVGALTVVTKSGKVKDCHIFRSSNSQALDAATCKALQRSKLTPGLNAAGEAIDSPKIFHIHWVFPAE